MDTATHDIELQGVSIVALGSFNPAIFQPAWFSSNNLIRAEEAREANIQIIQGDVAIFSTEWFSIQVTHERFSLDTRDPSKWLPMRDLVIGTFTILSHTPVRAVGTTAISTIAWPRRTSGTRSGTTSLPSRHGIPS